MASAMPPHHRGWVCWPVQCERIGPASSSPRAALAGEIDPLTDIDSRLFVGLPAAKE